MSTHVPLLPEMLRFRAASNAIIPVVLPAKRPAGGLLPRDEEGKPTWAPFQSEIPAESLVRRWRGAAGFAVVMGAVSGGREMADFDAEADTTFPLYWQRIEERCPGLMARLAIERTLNGGIHLHWRCSTVSGNLKLAMRPDPADPKKPETMIETRGEGGYAVVAPTPGYTVMQGDIANPPTITPAERAILLDEAATFNRWAPPDLVRGNSASTTRDGDRPGDEYNERATNEDVLDLMLAEGWTVARRFTGSYQLTRPGKAAAYGISATLGYCGRGVLYVFSSNAYPFEMGRAYSPFGVYALLRHGGDFAEAARELAEQGYGVRMPRLRVVPDDEPAGAPPPQLAEGLDEELPTNVVELQQAVKYWKARALRAETLVAEYHEREKADWRLFNRKDKTPAEKLYIKATAALYHERKDDPDAKFTDEGATVIPFYETEKMVGISPDAAYRAAKALDEAEKKRAAAGGHEPVFEYAPERKQIETETPAGKAKKSWIGATGIKMQGKTYAETVNYLAGVAPVRRDKDGNEYSGRSKWGGDTRCGCGSTSYSTRNARQVKCNDCGKVHRIVSTWEEHTAYTLPQWARDLLRDAAHQERQARAACAETTAEAATPPQDAEQVNLVPQDAEAPAPMSTPAGAQTLDEDSYLLPYPCPWCSGPLRFTAKGWVDVPIDYKPYLVCDACAGAIDAHAPPDWHTLGGRKGEVA